jgi:hypothetical protein
MSDESTASTLVLVGAIFQLVITIVFFGIVGIAIVFLGPLIFGSIEGFLIFLLVGGIFLVMAVPGLIFMLLWFSWRSHPSAHKTGLIVTGVFGLILAGVLPGLLVLIGGAIAPGESA